MLGLCIIYIFMYVYIYIYITGVASCKATLYPHLLTGVYNPAHEMESEKEETQQISPSTKGRAPGAVPKCSKHVADRQPSENKLFDTMATDERVSH